MYRTGSLRAASLLVAIGPRNAFVLRQGLRRQHVLAVVSACAVFELLLLAAGTGGLGAVVRSYPMLARWFGAGGASTLWFFARGLGARLLGPIFARPVAWRLLDAPVGVMMFALAGSLVASLLTGPGAAPRS